MLTAAASIEKILNLNQIPLHNPDDQNEFHSNGFLPESTPVINENGEPIWKVLVFDDLGRDVISSVMRVNDLRACGITIHL
jgi:sec1 family domain-containing protein 1